MTPERVREVLHYDPETGVFTWLVDRGTRACAGKIAGSPATNRHYMVIGLDGKQYKSHRLAWMWMTGEQPPRHIDHANRNPLDNRWCNIRECTPGQNRANARRNITSKAPLKGVSWHKASNKWRASSAGRHIGLFDSVYDAARAYDKASRERFGEYAACNFAA